VRGLNTDQDESPARLNSPSVAEDLKVRYKEEKVGVGQSLEQLIHLRRSSNVKFKFKYYLVDNLDG